MYDYGLIGNCQISAHVGADGAVDWLCLPRPDSPPVFGTMLDPEGGVFKIAPAAGGRGQQSYVPNTNVLVTRFTQADGSEFTVTDFCPRFEQYERMFRPVMLFRVVKPVRGAPAIQVNCAPVSGWDKQRPPVVRGNSHMRWEIRSDQLRLTTNMSMTYLNEGTPFVLHEPLYFALTWGSALEADVVKVSNDFLDNTIHYWRNWVKHCSIPTLYQRETIRSALTLKLHCYEDTGAILAGLTTSLPEIAGRERNWDYRFCWLRDAYFCLSAFHNLGHFAEMEGFMKYLISLVRTGDRLAPVYTLDQRTPLPEHEHAAWRGWKNSLPVRSNNQAGEHIQNDVYGELILALAPIFLDERFQHLRSPELVQLIETLARHCHRSVGTADAGLWEIRGGLQEHSFTNLMCWAGMTRARRILASCNADHALLPELDKGIAFAMERLYAAVKDGAMRNGPEDDTVDASLLLLPVLHFPDQEVNRRTAELISEQLTVGPLGRHSPFLFRYRREDDFGTPESAFLICSFWLVHAFARCGDRERAQKFFDEALRSGNELGLMSEHYDPWVGAQLGNFPQAYSHVGLINAAFNISPRWDEVF